MAKPPSPPSQAFGAALTKAKAAEGGGSSSSDRSSRQSAFEGRLRSAEGGAVPVPVPSGHGIGRGPVSSMTPPPAPKSARSSIDDKRASSPRSEVSALCVVWAVRDGESNRRRTQGAAPTVDVTVSD